MFAKIFAKIFINLCCSHLVLLVWIAFVKERQVEVIQNVEPAKSIHSGTLQEVQVATWQLIGVVAGRKYETT